MAENGDTPSPHQDVRYRFESLSKFFDFTEDDIKILNQLSIYIQPMIPVIVDKVYRKLFSFDITKQYFFYRHSSCLQGLCTSKPNTNMPFDGEEIEFRKNMLSKYLKRIFTEEEWDESFLQYLSNVGQIHTAKLGSPGINIDYIHTNLLMGFIESTFMDIIWKINNLDSQTKYKAISTLNKFFWIQNEFFKVHYKDD